LLRNSSPDLNLCRYDKAEKAKLIAKKKAALEKLEKGEAPAIDGEEERDDDKIDEAEEAGGKLHGSSMKQSNECCWNLRSKCLDGEGILPTYKS